MLLTGISCLLSPSKVVNIDSDAVVKGIDILYVARRFSSSIDAFLTGLDKRPFPANRI